MSQTVILRDSKLWQTMSRYFVSALSSRRLRTVSCRSFQYLFDFLGRAPKLCQFFYIPFLERFLNDFPKLHHIILHFIHTYITTEDMYAAYRVFFFFFFSKKSLIYDLIIAINSSKKSAKKLKRRLLIVESLCGGFIPKLYMMPLPA
jgi:hypothetical protein